MKPIRMRYLALATLLVTLGLLFLLNNFLLFSSIDFVKVIGIWPIILVLIGIYFLVRGHKFAYFITAFTSILIAIMLFSLLVIGSIRIPFVPTIKTTKTSSVNPNLTFTSDSEKYISSINKANLTFISEKGEFYLRGTTDTLTEYSSKTTFGEYLFEKSDKDGVATVDLRFSTERFPWKVTSDKNSIDLKLNPKPIWNLDYQISSSNLDLQLGYYKVEKTRIKSSISTISIQVENSTIDKEMKLEIDSGSSTINLRIQNGIGIELKYNSLLSVRDTPDFEDKGNNVFQTKDFDKSEKKIYIDSDLTVSRIKIERFE